MEYRYRPFQNRDTTQITKVWNANYHDPNGVHDLYCEMTPWAFSATVEAKTFFDPRFLYVAERLLPESECRGPFFRHEIVGFIHGGFSPNADMTGVDPNCTTGTIAMLLVKPGEDWGTVASGLLRCMEAAFREAGMTRVCAGSVYPHAPFYIGFSRRGNACGFLTENAKLLRLFEDQGYAKENIYRLYQIDLEDADEFLLVVLDLSEHDRLYSISIEESCDKKISPWESSAFEPLSPTRFVASERGTSREVGSVLSFQREVNGHVCWLFHNLHVIPECRNQGVGKYIVLRAMLAYRKRYDQIIGSSLRGSVGDTAPFLVLLQVPEVNKTACRLFDQLDGRFQTSVVLQKEME